MNFFRSTSSQKDPFQTGREIDDAALSLTEKADANIEWPLNRSVLWFFFSCMAMVVLAMGGRIFYLNVVKGAEYREQAEKNSIRSYVMPAPRGIIYDMFGKPLVHNAPSVDMVLDPRAMNRDPGAVKKLKESLQATFSFDSLILDAAFENVSALSASNASPRLLKERISQEEALLFLSRSRDFPGVELYKTMHREYSDSTIFSHLLGYVGKIRKDELERHPEYLLTDSIGKQGIEKSYENDLRGTRGYEQAEVDAFGQVKKELGMVLPKPGSDLILNIDADLEKKVFDSLSDWLTKQNLKRGAAIALDPRNGAVRALVSLPSFDNNLFAEGISQSEYAKLANDAAEPLFNRVISGEYPPGSTIKPVLAVAALSEGVIDEHTQIESKGGISIGNFFFGDWRVNGFTDVRRAIAVSSDVFFYSVGGGYGGIRGLGMDLMKKYESLFGYGRKTNIDLEGEASGFLPDPAWKQQKLGERWYIGDDYHAAIGQGFVTATPLQIVNAVAAIANGGTLYAPRVVSQIRTPDGKVTPVPAETLGERLADPHILQVVREGMRETVTEGTAQSLQNLPVTVAGKTGTAQFGNQEKTHGWFVSFAPYDNPTLVLLVLVEGQNEEGYNAVPITKDIYQWYFSQKR